SHDGFGYIPANPDTIGTVSGTLFVHLLNYVEQKPVYDQYTGDDKSVPGKTASKVVFKMLSCPSDSTTSGSEDYGPSNYVTNNLLFKERPKLPGSFPDGTSNTIMFTEKYARCSYWALMTDDGKSLTQVPWYVAKKDSGFQIRPQTPDCK